jgi:subtilisin family serine protease
MVGLYTQTEVPSADGPGKPNTSGWVYWSGTSFATPVISGMAANVLARNELARKADPAVPRLTPRQVMTSILDMAEPTATTDPALGCPYVAVTQRQ